MTLIDRIVSLVRRSIFAESVFGERLAKFSGETEEDFDSESRLFHCDRCGVTFISMDMDSCPRCGRAVEETPNEQDLDRFQVH